MSIHLYWWRGDGAQDSAKQNFGDYLSPLIVEMVSGKTVVHAEPHEADMIAIGSILSRERKARKFFFRRRLHIWGSGTDKMSRSFWGRHYYHAVRGEITRSQITGPARTLALGDPGLLVDRWWEGKTRPEKRYRLGIIPHFVDQQDKRVKDLAKLQGSRVIDVFAPVEEVVREIQRCDFILSSSMHGLIVADAFGIPNRRMPFSSGKISDLKFDDYYSAFGIGNPGIVAPEAIYKTGFAHPVFSEDYQRPGIERLKDGLIEAFPSL